MSKFFIKHPIVAMVISIIMVLLGVLSITSLPMEQYPNIVPPQIKITATYPGADCQTVADSVATPIEQQMSGVDHMEYMTSVNANNGQMTMTVFFEVGSEPDIDQVLTYLRYGQATSQLPAQVSQMGVTLEKSVGMPILLYSITSPEGTYDSIRMTNYAYVNLVNQLKRIDGVGSVMVFGSGQYAMRVWLDPDRMSALNISVSEVQAAIASQNTVNPAGKIGAEPAPLGQQFTYTIRAKGRLVTAEEFGNIIVRATPDAIVRVNDIATVELGAQTYDMLSRSNGEICASIAISQMPGSNALNVKRDCDKLLLKDTVLPPDLEIHKVLDTTLAISASIEEIVVTFVEAMFLVIMVVFVFLQGWRATLIPAFAVPVSIIGTFVVFPIIGYTLNTICLMGMVLAIGLVVDDAIVVVEAVEHHMDQGKTAKEATFAAMEEVSGPVVAIALVLASVFLPSLLLPGITGSLFQQFAVTIAISILISAFNALSLSPALCGIMLKPKNPNRRGPIVYFYNTFNKMFGGVQNFYTRTCAFLIRKMIISVLILGGMAACIMPLSKHIPGGFLPSEDQGLGMISMMMPDATALQVTSQNAKQVEEILINTPGVETCTAVVGYNMLTGVLSPNNAFFFLSMKPWAERTKLSAYGRAKAWLECYVGAIFHGTTFKEAHEEYKLKCSYQNYPMSKIVPMVNKELQSVTQAICFAFEPPAIPGVGSSGGVTLMLQDTAGNGQKFLTEETKIYQEALSAREEIAMVMNSMAPAVPQYFVEVDEAKALMQGVNVSNVYTTLQAYMGSVFINYFTLYGQQWQVYMQANAGSRSDIAELNKFYVQTSKGDSVPVTSLIKSTRIFAPDFIIHQNMYNSSQLNINGKPGYSSAQVMEACEEVFKQTMPEGMGYEYSGMSYQEKVASEGMSITEIFCLSGVFVFLILAALYESWALPAAVFFTVPIAVLGAFLGLWYFDQNLDLYAQIGLIMLIGLSCKNAILIVEFAEIELHRGKTLWEATLSAAQIRLRPILMTSIAFTLGCIPLANATGSGALSRSVIGICVVGGMLSATFIGTFLIPSFYYLVKRLCGLKGDARIVEPENSTLD